MQTKVEPGTPAAPGRIPLAVPHLAGNEWKYVKDCLDSGWVSSVGAYVTRLEDEMAQFVGRRYAVATASGTAALHTAILVSGIQPGDEILVSTLTFIAPVNAIRYCGAWPVFIDADEATWQMDPQKVVDFIERECDWAEGQLRNRTTGRPVKAIIPVHILGHPVDMDPILAIAEKYDLKVIEDASESLGAKYRGSMTGTLGETACFSFNGNKIITTGGGGMLVTDDEGIACRARYLTTQAKDDAVEYVHNEIGYNYRLTNMQAAMGCAQMEQLSSYVEIKRHIAARYNAQLAGVEGITVPPQAAWAESSYWLYTVLVDPETFGMDRRSLARHLSAAGVESRPLWTPIHLSRAHEGAFTPFGAPVAERLQDRGLSLPCSTNLTDAEVEMVANQIKDAHHQQEAGEQDLYVRTESR